MIVFNEIFISYSSNDTVSPAYGNIIANSYITINISSNLQTFLFSVLRIKNTLDLVNSSFQTPEDKVSKIIKLSFGLSILIISTILLLIVIEKGYFCLQSSQFIFLYFMTTWPLTAFIILLRSIHSRRHFKWMPPMVPEHPQGEIIGLKFVSAQSTIPLSQSRQIRQTIAEVVEFIEF